VNLVHFISKILHQATTTLVIFARNRSHRRDVTDTAVTCRIRQLLLRAVFVALVLSFCTTLLGPFRFFHLDVKVTKWRFGPGQSASTVMFALYSVACMDKKTELNCAVY